MSLFSLSDRNTARYRRASKNRNLCILNIAFFPSFFLLLSVDIIYCCIDCAFHAVRLICGDAVIDAQPDGLDILALHQSCGCGALDLFQAVGVCLPDVVNVGRGDVVGVHVGVPPFCDFIGISICSRFLQWCIRFSCKFLLHRIT